MQFSRKRRDGLTDLQVQIPISRNIGTRIRKNDKKKGGKKSLSILLAHWMLNFADKTTETQVPGKLEITRYSEDRSKSLQFHQEKLEPFWY